MRLLHRSAMLLVTAVLVLIALAPGARASHPPPPISYQSEVVARLTNSVGGEVLYRRGYWWSDNPGGGFGFDKVYWKHNIRVIDKVARVVNAPQVVRHEGGGTWVHERVIRLWFCGRGCIELDRRTIRVVINYWGWLGTGQQGVVTAYCLNPGGEWACPNWVNDAWAW